MANNKVTFGLSNICYSLVTQGISRTYGTPKRLQYAKEFTASVIGGKTDIYADNQVITTLATYSGQDITLKMSDLSDDFKQDILGYKKGKNGEMVEVTNIDPIEFALGIQIEGDAKARRIWYFSCTASAVPESSQTKTDSVSVNEPEITITAKPIEIGENKVLRAYLSKGDTGYNTYLTEAPVEPDLSEN